MMYKVGIKVLQVTEVNATNENVAIEMIKNQMDPNVPAEVFVIEEVKE